MSLVITSARTCYHKVFRFQEKQSSRLRAVFLWGISMDFTTGALSAAAAGVFAVFGWFLKRSITQLDDKLKDQDDAIKEQRKDFDAHRLHVAERYVTSDALQKAIDAFNRSIDAVFAKLEQIDGKLDKKADK